MEMETFIPSSTFNRWVIIRDQISKLRKQSIIHCAPLKMPPEGCFFYKDVETSEIIETWVNGILSYKL